MDDIADKVLAEKENIEISLNNLQKAMAIKNKTVIELAAIGTFLHNIYKPINLFIQRILLFIVIHPCR